jgi:hypothetical protein
VRAETRTNPRRTALSAPNGTTVAPRFRSDSRAGRASLSGQIARHGAIHTRAATGDPRSSGGARPGDRGAMRAAMRSAAARVHGRWCHTRMATRWGNFSPTRGDVMKALQIGETKARRAPEVAGAPPRANRHDPPVPPAGR